jgi:acyl-coenzyme A synthetase/AMP-(fatty) acid ligase
MLFIVVRLEQDQQCDSALIDDINTRNRRLPDFKRITGCLVWPKDFPRTASLKIKRTVLADEIGKSADQSSIIQL